MESLQFEAIIENELFSKDLRSLAAPNQIKGGEKVRCHFAPTD